MFSLRRRRRRICFVSPLRYCRDLSHAFSTGLTTPLRYVSWDLYAPLRYQLRGLSPLLGYMRTDPCGPTAGGNLQSFLWLTKASLEEIVKISGGRFVRV